MTDPEQAATGTGRGSSPQDHEDEGVYDESSYNGDEEDHVGGGCCTCRNGILTLAFSMGLVGLVMGSLAYTDVQRLQSNDVIQSIMGGGNLQGDQARNGGAGGDGQGGGGGGLDGSDSSASGSTLAKILQRGTLNCGLPFDNTPGFLLDNEGIDVELCKAISAAIFGTPNFEAVPISSASDRWTFLQDDDDDKVDVDVVMRSTHTLERDVFVEQVGTGFEFSPVYFYDGLLFGGVPPYVTTCAEQVNATAGTVCESLSICAVAGTTHLETVRKLFSDRHIQPRPNLESLYSGLVDETCNVIAWELNGVAENVVRLNGYQGLYETGTKYFSREPLAVATREDDPKWTDFIFWIIQALLSAEEKGITQATAGEFQTTELFGPDFENMFQNVIAAVGNYGEMYENTVAPFIPRGGMNRINGGDTGLLYSFPFGKLDSVGTDIEQTSPTIRAIRQRGFLNCGVNNRKGFASFDPVTRSWSGFDVELCRAIAAAVFEGVDHVVYSDLPTSERFKVLADGRVDVLARLTTWTMQRDILEPSSNAAFSFASPYFHDGVQFAGVPPFDQCAETLDVFSPSCQALKFCVLDGSTSHDKLSQLFHGKYYTTKLIFDEIIDALNDGSCNAIAGGFHDVAVSTIREKGYAGPYQVRETRFSKDPLGIVTRQDNGDVVWSNFVRWINWALIYAEENNITQATAIDMPRSTLFGPLRSETFFHVVNTVGNYGEMYERNFAELVHRGGLNALNDNNGPQMYALAGI